MNDSELSSTSIQHTTIEHWDHLIDRGNKRQRKEIRVVLPYFIVNGLQVDDIDDIVLTKLFQYLQAPERNNSENGLSEKHARWTVNSAVHAITDLYEGEVPFKPLEGPRDRAEEQHDRFLDTYGVEIDRYQSARHIDQGSKNAEVNAFKNCIRALEDLGSVPNSLESLVMPDHRSNLMQALYERGRKGSFVQAMRTLAMFALHCDHGDAEDAHEAFSAAAHEQNCSQAMPSGQVSRLLPHIEKSGFKALFDQLFAEALVPSDFDPSTIRRNNRIASALYALLAIFAPATFKHIHHASFTGRLCQKQNGERRLLKIPPHDEGLEECIHDHLSGMIDNLYWAYHRAGVIPSGIMVDRNGLKRPSSNAVRSVEILLRSLKIKLTLLDLREIGVAKALQAGDDPNKVARAVRMSDYAFWKRYSEFSDTVKKIKA